jgi:hypothetical protein
MAMLTQTMQYNGTQTADLILKPLFKNPMLNALFSMRTDVLYREPLNVVGPLTGIIQKYTGCAQLPTSGNAGITQRFLAPQKMQAHVQQCADVFDRTILEEGKKKGVDWNNLDGTAMGSLLESLAVNGLTLDLFRLIFFGDTASANAQLNIIDGVWKKTFAGVADANPDNAIPRTIIPDVLATNTARDTFKKMLTTGSTNILKQAIRNQKALILCTGAMFDNYLESKESANNVGVDQAYLNELNGMSTLNMGIEAIPYRGIPVLAMRDWDTEIAFIAAQGGASATTNAATSASNVLNFATTTGIVNGQAVTGTGIGAGVTVTGVTPTTVTISGPAVTVASGVLIAFALATPNTHRAYLWIPGNHFIGTDKDSQFNEFKHWYSDDFDLNNLRARFRADYNYAIGQFNAVAYSNG